jgi:VacB/RNase II family 3'-5' exoribonuclease
MGQMPGNHQHRTILERIAERVMLERGLLPTFSSAAAAEAHAMHATPAAEVASRDDVQEIRDQTHLLWASIDNDDSRDLDQLTVAEKVRRDEIRILVAIADVDALVKDGSAIDGHARHNTTSVYTAARIFPMLPERLSNDLTSLNPGEDRLAVVVDMVVDADGAVPGSDIYPARVQNRAKLAYGSVAAWLGGTSPPPAAVTAVRGLDENLRLQDVAAQRLNKNRHLHGALSLATTHARPTFENNRVTAFDVDQRNRASEIIEAFMIAANGVTARYLAAKNVPSIRRVVHTPKRWDRIVALAKTHGVTLPATADSAALDAFLVAQRAADPMRFPDLSLAVVKLLGSGEYVADAPGGPAPGHFGLAVKDYAHATAPNRRYPDLVTQRLLKAAMSGRTAPYAYEDLTLMARDFTVKEDAVGKSAAAMLLESRMGEEFDALVTGASQKGTWARLKNLPAEGRVVRGFENLDVGDQIRVKVASVDVERGFIDLARVTR